MWKPISPEEFEELFRNQRSRLAGDLDQVFARFRVPVTTAIIRRSPSGGDERVFVVAASPKGVLYFDDVEYGFNFSSLSRDLRIENPGGSQSDLADAVRSWLMPQMEKS